jgi:protein-disulfide isomerase
MARFALSLVLLLFAWAGASASAQQSFNAQQQAEIRAMVRNYLVNNPDVLREALNALQQREQNDRVRRAEHDPRDFSIGPADAPVTVVEFFDYRCPFCMAALPWVMDTLRTRRDVRYVFKEMPIAELHGEPAIQASLASIAAMPQGRYLQFHQALLNWRGELTPERIDALARQSGIDVARMRRGMTDPAVMQLLRDNTALAASISGSQGLGTPTFLVNGRVLTGFRDGSELDAAIRDARREAMR